MIKNKVAKRCLYCKKILRGYNKSQICSSCRNAKKFPIDKKVIKNVNLL